MGNYKVNVTSAGGVSCPLNIDVSALACATPATFDSCGVVKTISLSDTEKLKNLAVGDEFSTYDYIVRVTEVVGNETNGWTGKGELVMNFLKIGGSPVVEIPLAVIFTNMHLNQCYQILPGSKVITALDPNWTNVVDVDNITDRLSDIYAEIKDLLVSAPGDTATLNAKIRELNSIKTDLSNSEFSGEYKTDVTNSINSVTTALSCYIGNPGARTANTCTVDDVTTSIGNAANAGDCKNPYKGKSEVFDSIGRVAGESNSNGKYVVIKSQSLVCQTGYKYELFSEFYASNLTRVLIPDTWAPLFNALKYYGGVVGVPGNIVYEISNYNHSRPIKNNFVVFNFLNC